MPTKIEWSDETWPVVTGCTHAGGPGCDSCYAARMAATRLRDHPRYEGLAVMHDGKPKWTGKINLNHDVLEQPLHWRKPRMVFVASMGDLFHDDVPDAFISKVFRRMLITPRHTFQVLTKRPGRMSDYVQSHITNRLFAVYGTRFEWPPANIWLGTSIENQAAADERREYLEQCPAAVKFVSYEPALGPIDWTGWGFVDQIISGGESGPNARPSHPNWHRATRDFCQANEIAYFFKQWGEYLGIDYTGEKIAGMPAWTRADGLLGQIGKRPGIDFGDGHGAVRVGRKRAGRLLDGQVWDQFPKCEGKLSGWLGKAGGGR